ncbi:MAG: BTAD domain-containing putative transcriptional regulator, partial [Streptosporangiaceae bacterium]
MPVALAAGAGTPARLVPADGVTAGPLPAGAGVIGIRLLGRFTAQRGVEEIPLRAFGGRRARQLLRLLALHRGTLISKDVIADALWPTTPPADPDGNIEVLVSRIRKALGDRSLIQTGSGGYTLAGDGRCQVDTEAFLAAVEQGRARLAGQPAEALASFREALEAWRGEPLAEDAYADWAQQDQRLLSLAFLEALEGAAAAALATGDPAGAAAWAGQALARDPLRETAAMFTVQALAAGGDQAGALAEFDSFRSRLASETGLDPSPGAREIRQRVLHGEPLPAGPPRRPDGRPPRSSWAGLFTGRRKECAAILAAVAGGGPRVVVVTGSGGTGKSRLLAETARLAQVPVLDAQASAADSGEAWALAGHLLRQARELAGAAGMELADQEARALAALVPGLAGPAAATAGSLDGQNQRDLASQGAVRLVAAAARPRCLIVVDDLQWADPASLTLLGLILRRVGRASMVTAYQPGGPGTSFPVAETLGIPAEHVAHIRLGPLPAEAIRELCSDPLLAETILEQADHTSLAVTEIIAALAGRGTAERDDQGRWRLRSPGDAAEARAIAAGVRHAGGARLAELPGSWRELLALLALLGRPAAPALLAGASGRELREVLEALEGLDRAGLAQPGQQGWNLGRELSARELAGALHPAGKARLHTLLAQALRHSDADPAEVAGHLQASGDRAAAAAVYASHRITDEQHRELPPT